MVLQWNIVKPYGEIMQPYLKDLDDYFCQTYNHYTKISAIEGYEPPKMIALEGMGKLLKKDERLLMLCEQPKKAELLKKFKQSLSDAYFSFSFVCPTFKQRIGETFSSKSVRKLLKKCLVRAGETLQSAGEKLDISPKIWKKISKGQLYPEKNTILALALACRLSGEDVEALLSARGYELDTTDVRDVVVGYLIKQKIYNEKMRDECLAEYAIESLPLRREVEIA